MIANLADNSRSSWLGAAKWETSPSASLASLRYAVLHVPGTSGRQPDTRADIAQRLRNQHARDLTNLPGNFKYSFVADQLGETWEGRGLLLRNAANGSKIGTAADKRGANWNLHSVSIQLMVATGEQPPARMVDAVRRLLDRLRLAVGRDLTVVGHRDGRGLGYDSTQTDCPGGIIAAMIARGAFAPVTGPTAPPVQRPGTYTVHGGDTWYGIARQHRVPLGDLLIANAPIIRPGQVVTIPDTAQ